MTKTIIFKHNYGHSKYDFSEEEFYFDDDATDEEIEKEYVEWMLSLVQDSCNWYEKEEEK